MKRALAIVALLSVVSPAVVRPQQQQGAPQTPSPSFSSALSIDTQGIKNYLLGPGDVLDVRVLFQSDLNALVEVDSDGNITSLPFLESPIVAKCRNEREVQKDITKAFSKYIKNPQVSVRITEMKSRPPATITGAVRQPTRVTMLRKVRLNELMAQAEGFTERASGTIQILHTEPPMCPQPGEPTAQPADDEKSPLEVVKIADLKAGRSEANPVIRPGDLVVVTEAEPVYVTGSVFAPQAIYLTDNLTLSRALATVGGTTKLAKNNDVWIYRVKPGVQTPEVIRVDYAAIKKNQKPDVVLQAFDQVDVPEAGILSRGRIGETLMGLVTGTVPGVLTAASSRPAPRTTVIR
ncbi:MAG TPA: polysaccharide biosynthesis/export family protein [Pyrinomonadaceae bacterium]|nr:polysaccharide biosynthesis/export family protein [Pyrinomonadaceae bacterium]